MMSRQARLAAHTDGGTDAENIIVRALWRMNSMTLRGPETKPPIPARDFEKVAITRSMSPFSPK